MNPLLIPDADPTGLPAPVWLLKGLLVFTFILHLVPMNLILGGGLVTAWASWRGKALAARGDARSRFHEALAARVITLLPVATAFTITLGIAPLLFVQVLYGQLFYTSSVLMAWAWLAVIGLLMIGYYGYYGAVHAEETLSWRTSLLSFGSAAIFLAIGLIFTTNSTLLERPEAWSGLYAASDQGTHWNFGDPTVWPRFLHFAIASFAFTGLFLAILGWFQRRSDSEAGEWTCALGARLFAVSTVAQLAVGLWFFFVLPQRVQASFLGASFLDTAVLWGSALLAVAAIPLVRRRPWLALALVALTLAGMAVARQRERTLALAPHWSTEGLLVEPQTDVFLIFVALLLGGLALVGWMVWKFVEAGRPRLDLVTGEGTRSRTAA